MAELDTITIINPTKEDFECYFNGERYMMTAQEEKSFPKFLAYHIAKHLSDKMLGEFKEQLRRKHAKDNPLVPQSSTLYNHDNPRRRITLYDVLRSTEYVQEAVIAFNLKGFVGEMKEYDTYVEKQTAKQSAKSSEKET